MSTPTNSSIVQDQVEPEHNAQHITGPIENQTFHHRESHSVMLEHSITPSEPNVSANEALDNDHNIRSRTANDVAAKAIAKSVVGVIMRSSDKVQSKLSALHSKS